MRFCEHSCCCDEQFMASRVSLVTFGVMLRGAESCVRSDHERGKISEYFCIPRNLCEGFCPVTYTLKHMIYQPHHRNGMHHMTGQTYLIGLGNEKNILVRFRGKNTSLGLGNKNTWPGFGNNIFGLV